MSRNLSGSDLAWWHQRYLRQAEWTKSLRFHLYRRLEIARRAKIMEIGCGTGVIAGELAERTRADIHGLDIDPSPLGLLKHGPERQNIFLTAGDASALPFPDQTFDLIITHYLWLWIPRPEAVLGECQRVLKEGGFLAALAEPDYSKRLDVPEGHPGIREFLSKDLRDKGADPDIGGKLKGIFSAAGLKTEAGMINDEICLETNRGMFRQEWELLEKLGYPPNELAALKDDPVAKMTVPVCWAIGRKI